MWLLLLAPFTALTVFMFLRFLPNLLRFDPLHFHKGVLAAAIVAAAITACYGIIETLLGLISRRSLLPSGLPAVFVLVGTVVSAFLWASSPKPASTRFIPELALPGDPRLASPQPTRP